MGFYIKKSINLGGVRLNLSNGGLGVSTGIKGFRVGMNGRGTYVHMGRGGLYYRQQLSWNRPRSRDSRPSIRPAMSASEESGIFFTENLAQPLDISSGLAGVDHVLAHFRAEPGPIWISWLLGVGAICALFVSVAAAIALAVICLASIPIIKATNPKRVLVYDLEGEAEARFESLVIALEEYFLASKLWLYEQVSHTSDWKRNAGANALIKRRPAVAHTEGENAVRSNISIPTLTSGADKIYFLPDLVVCSYGASLSAFSYVDLDFHAFLTRFVESEGVPGDARIVDQTWQFSNKNGGPDRRFNNNRMLPVCQYQEAKIALGESYNRTLTKSRISDPGNLYQAFSRMRAVPLTAFQIDPLPTSLLAASEALAGVAETVISPVAKSEIVPLVNHVIQSEPMTSPFGIEFYSSIDKITIVNDLGQNKYIVEPISRHPLFSMYFVQTNNSGEIVWIKGVSDPIENDSFGIAIRALVDRIADQLAQKYSRGQKADFIQHGATWDDPQYWMNALDANERSYFHLWDSKNIRTLPDDLESIYVGANANDSFSSTAILEYASAKFSEAEAEGEQDMAAFL